MDKGIQKMFSSVAGTYELVNRVLTVGLDAKWRRKAARIAGARGGKNWLDICSGTGETAMHLQRLAAAGTRVFAADFCPPMLEKARQKIEAQDVLFAVADAGELPFRKESFDLITISFATRNINTSRDALLGCFREFHRLLVPGGCFVNLETSQPRSGSLRRLFHLYVELLVKPVGRYISGSRAAYVYLSHTIPRFYDAQELAELLWEAGFSSVRFHNLLGGVAAIHEAVK
jgi:demethylmenaquinone methyltransferase/2-methoxy-6-polyprenyl-1,4-benzoquinol methylase